VEFPTDGRGQSAEKKTNCGLGYPVGVLGSHVGVVGGNALFGVRQGKLGGQKKKVAHRDSKRLHKKERGHPTMPEIVQRRKNRSPSKHEKNANLRVHRGPERFRGLSCKKEVSRILPYRERGKRKRKKPGKTPTSRGRARPCSRRGRWGGRRREEATEDGKKKKKKKDKGARGVRC